MQHAAKINSTCFKYKDLSTWHCDIYWLYLYLFGSPRTLIDHCWFLWCCRNFFFFFEFVINKILEVNQNLSIQNFEIIFIHILLIALHLVPFSWQFFFCLINDESIVTDNRSASASFFVIYHKCMHTYSNL